MRLAASVYRLRQLDQSSPQTCHAFCDGSWPVHDLGNDPGQSCALASASTALPVRQPHALLTALDVASIQYHAVFLKADPETWHTSVL